MVLTWLAHLLISCNGPKSLTEFFDLFGINEELAKLDRRAGF
jgi:hypothetical protein